MRWMLLFFALITGLPALVFYLPARTRLHEARAEIDSTGSSPLPVVFSLRC
jgi:hypothetical protein